MIARVDCILIQCRSTMHVATTSKAVAVMCLSYLAALSIGDSVTHRLRKVREKSG